MAPEVPHPSRNGIHRMDAQTIRSFIEATHGVFSTTLGTRVDAKAPMHGREEDSRFDVWGTIELSGDVAGSIVLRFSTESASGIVKASTGMDLEPGSADFADAVGELINMVSDSGRSKLEGRDINCSRASVFVGNDQDAQQPKDTEPIVVPFNSPMGGFVLEMAFGTPSSSGNMADDAMHGAQASR